jgi:hypothetical protein
MIPRAPLPFEPFHRSTNCRHNVSADARHPHLLVSGTLHSPPPSRTLRGRAWPGAGAPDCRGEVQSLAQPNRLADGEISTAVPLRVHNFSQSPYKQCIIDFLRHAQDFKTRLEERLR